MLRTALCFAVALAAVPALGGVVLNESFDSDAGFTKSSEFFSVGSDRYFGLLGTPDNDFDGNGLFTTPLGAPDYAANGFDANHLLGERLSGGGGPDTVTLTWSGLSIAGLTDLSFSGKFSAGVNGFWDSGEGIDVDYQIDSGGFHNLLHFRRDGSFELAVDSDFNGVGDGASLALAAQTLTAAIAGTGTTLDLRLTLSANQADEEFAVDDLMITGQMTAIPEPSVGIVLGAAWLLRRAAKRRAAHKPAAGLIGAPTRRRLLCRP